LNLQVNPSTEADVDSSRLRTGEIVAGIGGVAMFVFLFFDWFSGAPELSGNAVTGATLTRPGISGWDALVDLPGFLIILAAVSGIALVWLAASGQRVNIAAPRGGVTAALGSLAVLLILWRMFAGSPTLKIGVFLGLAAAVAIAAGALLALMEDSFQPLVSVAAGRTPVAAASAPAAVPSTAPTEEVPATTPAPSKSGSRSRSSTSRSKSSGSRSAAAKGKSSSATKGRSSPRSGGSKSGGTRKGASGGRK
jgi:hypothetical protein